MPIEFDDRKIVFLGNNFRGIEFRDDDRTLQAEIYLTEDNQLNIGSLQVSGGNGTGESTDLSDVGFVTISGSPLLSQERVLTAGDGIALTDQGGGNNLTVAVDVTDLIGSGLAETGTNNIGLATPGTLSVTSNNSAAGNHTHDITTSSNPGAAARILASTAAGALTLQRLTADNVRLDGNTVSSISGDLTLSAAGGDVVLPSAINVGADNFVSQLTGWRVTYAGAADFRNIYADELHVKAFIADIEQALAGGEIVSKSVAIISRDFTVPVGGRDITSADEVNDWVAILGDLRSVIPDGGVFIITGSTGNDGTYTVDHTTFSVDSTVIWTVEDIPDGTNDGEVQFRRTIYVEDLPGFADTAVFASSDWLRLRVIDRSGGGLVVADVWGIVSNYTDQTGGEQSWSFRCTDDGGEPGEVVNAGAIAIDYGASGDGYWEVTALDSDGPYSQVVTWATDPSVPGNHTLRSRLGNLDGVTDAAFPTIGGWGLYSDNVYLKGEAQIEGTLTAAGGDVVIDSDGITIAAGSLAANRITWDRSGTTAGYIGTTIGDDMQINATSDADITAGGTITLTSTFGLVDVNGSVTIDSGLTVTSGGADIFGDLTVDTDTLVVDSTNNRVGINRASPPRTLQVDDDVAGFVVGIFNDGNASTRSGMIIVAGEDANPSHAIISFRDGDGGAIGSITGDGSGGTNFNQTSDERKKQDIAPLTASLSRVLALEPIEYRGKGAPQSRAKVPGFSAQQVAAHIPAAATYDEEQDLYGIAWNKIIPDLVGAIQELAQRVETLEVA